MIWMERHDDADNIHRFYALDITRDLFGHWLQIRRWGRVGRGGGQRLVQSFETRADARSALQELIRAKFRRGYA